MLVVYGHSLSNPNKGEMILLGIIYSFHLPLFFILSAITSRYSLNKKEFKHNTLKSIKHLLIPAIIIFSFNILYEIFLQPRNFLSLHFWKESFSRFIYFGAIGSVGFTWFFVALLMSKIIFDFLQLTIPKKYLLTCVILATCIGVALGKHNPHNYVFSFDVGLAMSIFLYVGYRIKNLENIRVSFLQKMLLFLLFIIVWILPALFVYREFLDIAQRRYPIFPLGFITAIAGSFIFIEIAKLLEKAKIFYPLQFLGRYCIYFYCVHCVDEVWSKWYRISNNNIIIFLTRVAIDLVFFLVLVGLHISITKIIQHRKLKKESKV